MALDFPNTPQTGQTYTGGNGVTYVFDGTKWVSESALGYQFDFSRLTNGQYVVQLDATGNLVIPVNGDVIRGNTSAFEEAGAVATVSDTEPDTGDATFWFNTIDGRLYIKDNGVWVDSSPTLLPTPSYIYSQLENTVGNIIPDANNVYSLGSPLAQWKDLWVSNATIYLNSVPLGVDVTGNLTYDGNPLVSFVNGNLSVGGNVVSGGASTGNISFVDTTMTSTANLTVESGGNVFINPLDGDYSWQFGTDGTTTFPGGGHISATKGGTALDAGYGYNTSLTTFYANANYAACVTGDAQTGTLNITAYNDGGPNPGRVWSFDKTGNLTLPTSANINYANGRSILSGLGGGNPFNQNLNTTDAATFANVSTTIGFISQINGTNPGGELVIQTNNTHNWNFTANGALTFPNGAKIGSDDAYKFATDNTVVTAVDMRDTSGRGFYTDSNGYTLRSSGEKNWGFGTTGILTLPSNSYVETTDADLKVGSQGTVTIRANAATVGGTRAWTFGANGTLTFPGGATFDGETLKSAPNDFDIGLTDVSGINSIRVGTGVALITTNNNEHSWQFGLNGATTFPGNISVPGNLSNIAGFAFYNGDPISIVATAPINSIRFIQPYYIEIPKTGLPAGFDTLLGSGTWTVTANASTFTVVMVVPNGDFWNITVAENPNGTLTSIATFNRAASGANIVIPSSGSINFANGVNILSTVGTYSNTNVASYLLQFDGDIEFTSSTAKIGNVDVVTVGDHIRSPAYQFSNGASILSNVVTKVTGTWTATTGTNTYSFTVPASGTYQLWVDCNIPNGILAYNATATITNSNVPVVGAQYAWVYNGGGTPIDFVSIPNQFTGTANTIVRSNTAPSITTNRFDFGINNTSGGNVTVTYGYIKIS